MDNNDHEAARGSRSPNANEVDEREQNDVRNNDSHSNDVIDDGTRYSSSGKEKKSKGTRRKYYNYLVPPRIGCLKLKVEEDEQGNVDMRVVGNGIAEESPYNPTHLIITVNGIIGGADNWKFAAKQFLKQYPRDVIVHCSKSNYGMLTFHGVDVMGDRLAEEVVSVIKRHPSVKKISFIGHSLGGLIARYAIAKLYEHDLTREPSQGNGDCECDAPAAVTSLEEKTKGKVAGLEPMNFITSATPHLGSRGHKQVPLFGGSYPLEKVAAHLSWFLGRTGKHLFLTDGKNGKPPLLLQMVHDSEDLKFISALQSFKCRVAYANVRFDKLVGWSTSSLRRRHELPKKKDLARDHRYRHVVHVKSSEMTLPQQEVPTEANDDGHKTSDFEEQMFSALTTMSWERVDVKFNGSKQRFLAHGSIQVQNLCIYAKGVDVIQHMVDTFLL